MSNLTSQQDPSPQSSSQTAPSTHLPCGCLRSSIMNPSSPLKSPLAYPSSTASFSSTSPRRIIPSLSSSSSASSVTTSTPTSLHRSDTDYSDLDFALDLAFSPTDTAFSPVLTGEEAFEHSYYWQYYIPHISTSTADYYTDCSWIAFDLVEPPTAGPQSPSAAPTAMTENAAARASGEVQQMETGTGPLRSPIPRTPEEVELPFIGEEEFEYYTSPTEGAGMRYPFIGYVRAGRAEMSPVTEGDNVGGRGDGAGNDDERRADDPNRGQFGQLRRVERGEGVCGQKKGRGLAKWLGSLSLGRRSGRRSRRFTS